MEELDKEKMCDVYDIDHKCITLRWVHGRNMKIPS